AIVVQGGQGGGHTGNVATSILLPQVVDAVGGRIPVVAAGGFFDGRGLVAALAYGADGVAMGTRFLLSSDSAVPDAVKQRYLGAGVADTVVSRDVDGVPHRVLATELVEQLGRRRWLALPRALRNAQRFRALTKTPYRQMLREGLAMRRSMDLTVAQMIMAANTPMLLKAALVDGKVESGVMASGQVVGVIDDLPSCQEIVAGIIADAREVLAR
ncbi:MAG TPA: nitronate monooxygenase, partial [Ilumatobacteraceae bacterium]|nr:nitronate monooxygenase [Ilumatobacteraceae bacterium]